MPKFLDVPKWYENGSTYLYRAAVPIINTYTKIGSPPSSDIEFQLDYTRFPGNGAYIGFYSAEASGSSTSDFYFGIPIFFLQNNKITFCTGMVWASNKSGSSVNQTSGGYFAISTKGNLRPVGDQNVVFGLVNTTKENFIFFKVADM